jgi:hypothetical protein
VQVTPLASEKDAQATLKQFTEKSGIALKNLGVMDLVRSERTIEGIEIPGAEDVWGHEIADGIRDDIAMLATGRVGELVFVLLATAPQGGWSWEDVIALAAKQAERLQLVP